MCIIKIYNLEKDKFTTSRGRYAVIGTEKNIIKPAYLFNNQLL